MAIIFHNAGAIPAPPEVVGGSPAEQNLGVRDRWPLWNEIPQCGIVG
jgi:hypothetical protein